MRHIMARHEPARQAVGVAQGGGQDAAPERCRSRGGGILAPAAATGRFARVAGIEADANDWDWLS